MSIAKRIPLGIGLPTHLCVGKEGFKALCALLGITSRDHKQTVVNAPSVKRWVRATGHSPAQGSRTAERHRHILLALYSDPKVRRDLWQQAYDISPKDQAENKFVPSLEYAALTQYDDTLHTVNPDVENLAGLEAFYDPELVADDWRKPALAAVPQLVNDFGDWASIPRTRREEIIAAAFAVATLLEDARLLLWAAGRGEDIHQEFELVLSDVAKETQDQVGTNEVDVGANLREQQTKRALALRDAASDLAEGSATEEMFEALVDRYAEVLALREPLLSQAATKEIGEIIDGFATRIDQATGSPDWLASEIESVVARWREVYLPPVAVTTEQLSTDIDRAIAALESTLPEVETAQAKEKAAKDSFHSHESDVDSKPAPSRADRKRQAEVTETLHVARQLLDQAIEDVFDALTPHPDGDSPTEALTESGPDWDLVATTSTEPKAIPNSRAPTPAESTEAVDASSETPTHPLAPLPMVKPAEGTIPKSKPQKKNDPAKPVEPPNEAPAQSTEQTVGGDATSPSPTAQPKVIPATETEENASSEPATAVWRAIGNGRLGLAYHIARLNQAVGGGPTQPSPELLAAVALGITLCGPEDEVAAKFGEYVGALSGLDIGAAEGATGYALNLLLLAATLRPALFASQHGASVRLLRRVKLPGALAPVYRLAAAVTEHAEMLQTVYLDVPNLVAILDEGVWKDRLEEHGENVAQWRENASSATFLFAPAGVVWLNWLSKDGILGTLTNLLQTDSSANLSRVKEILGLLEDKGEIHALIEKTRQQTSGTRGESIDGRARRQLEDHLDEPLDLARRWLRLMEAKPGGAGFVETTVQRLHSAVENCSSNAISAIQHLRQDQLALPLASALACAEVAVSSLIDLFRRQDQFSSDVELRSEQVLSDDLLLVPGLPINDQRSIEKSLAPEDALALLIDIGRHFPTLVEAFDYRLNQGDLYAAHAIYERMAVENDDAEDNCRLRLIGAVSAGLIHQQSRLYELSERLEQAFIIGEVLEDERADAAAAIADASRRIEEKDHTLTVNLAVDDIALVVEPPFERGIEKLSEELEAFLPLGDEYEFALVQDAQRSRDLTTLHEQLDYLRRNQPLRSLDRSKRSQLASFVDAVDQIDAQPKGQPSPTHHELMEALINRQDILGLRFSSLSPAGAERSIKLLERWFKMTRQRPPERWLETKRQAPPDRELVADFFNRLGFDVAEAEAQPDGTFSLRTKSLRDRALCPSYAFGSVADGRYDLVFNWNAPAREPIIQAVANSDLNAHTIVLHFGSLSRSDRDWLRRWSIDQAAPFIAIDETVVLYLASLSEGALGAMFRCTLPFTYTEPFFTAPGLVPPESFFGRKSELNNIKAAHGSCFVYGGRQLGKTALLHAVRADFHNPNAGHLALYLDLKYEDLGYAQDADHIWQVLWREFSQLGIVESGSPKPRGRNSFANAIATSVSTWLDEHEDGRILLLLDEADKFLARDLEADFRVSTRLKGLMEHKNRRFKVVFCGLHNVLRNTERANHPLAHLGESICVGPLLANGDLEQARALIQGTLASAGYQFETDNLITKILVWTNYYPSLIQVYGEALLRYLRQAPNRDFPDVVTADDIQAVWSHDQLRDHIRNRFSLTLKLDERYLVIAYAMALDLQGASDKLVRGLSSNEILELAKSFWSEGFDISKREFGTLLREMCGLGILRRRGAFDVGTYVFRNPNVLRLLGDADDILDVLGEKRETPDIFHASAFHAPFGGTGTESPLRGPLTYEQEALLKRGGRVAVLCGTSATNVAAAPDFLKERMTELMEEDRLKPLELNMEANMLASALNRLRPPEHGTYICIVDGAELWNLRWLERIADALRKAKRGRNMRVVFQADPTQLWRFVKELPDEFLLADNDLFDWIAAEPWNAAFLRQWCSDQGLHEAGAKTADLLKLTGGWPLLLERYAVSKEKTWEARSAELNRHIENHREEILEAVGLGELSARNELVQLYEWGTLTADEIDTYEKLWSDEGGGPIEAGVLRSRLHWANKLGLLQDVEGSTEPNPLVARLLNIETR